MNSTALSFDALERAVAALPDNGLSALRRAALEQLRRDGLPGAREEDWKYTELSSLIEIANNWLDQGAALPAPSMRAAPDAIDATWIRIANGQIDDDSITGLPDGISVKRLSDTVPELAPAGRLGDFNIALLHDGLHISIGQDVTLQRPLGIHVCDEAGADSVSQVRINIDVAPGSVASRTPAERRPPTGGRSCDAATSGARRPRRQSPRPRDRPRVGPPERPRDHGRREHRSA